MGGVFHGWREHWSRAGRETGSVRGVVSRDARPEQVTSSYRHGRGLRSVWEHVKEPVELTWTVCDFGGEALVHLPWSGAVEIAREAI